VWGCGPKKFQKCISGGPTFVHMVEILMGRCEISEIEIMVVVACKRWLHRNGVVYGGEFTHPQKVLKPVNLLLIFEGLC